MTKSITQKPEVKILPVITNSKSYNRPSENNVKFAQKNHIYIGEYCIRNVEKRAKSESTQLDKIAGNGRYGFPAKRIPKEPVRIVKGLDGQDKKARKSVVKPRKNVCRLWSLSDIKRVSCDPIVRKEKLAIARKNKRTRNHGARRGRK